MADLPTAYWNQLVQDRAAVAVLKESLRLMIVAGEPRNDEIQALLSRRRRDISPEPCRQ